MIGFVTRASPGKGSEHWKGNSMREYLSGMRQTEMMTTRPDVDDAVRSLRRRGDVTCRREVGGMKAIGRRRYIGLPAICERALELVLVLMVGALQAGGAAQGGRRKRPPGWASAMNKPGRSRGLDAGTARDAGALTPSRLLDSRLGCAA